MTKAIAKTHKQTEYCGFYKETDGKCSVLPFSKSTKPELVVKKIEEHNILAKQHPTLMTYYKDYEIRKRTVITTYEEWSKAE